MTDEHDDALEMMPAKPSEVSSRGRRKEVERGRAGGKTPEMRGKEGEGGRKRGDTSRFNPLSTGTGSQIILNTFKV